MTTLLPKDPEVTDRKSVILSDAERRNLRRKLRGTVEVAQDVLHPRNQIRRFLQRKKNASGEGVGRRHATCPQKCTANRGGRLGGNYICRPPSYFQLAFKAAKE